MLQEKLPASSLGVEEPYKNFRDTGTAEDKG